MTLMKGMLLYVTVNSTLATFKEIKLKHFYLNKLMVILV